MIRVVPDVLSPITVTAVDLVGETMAPQWSEGLTYAMTVLGYVAGGMNWGGDYTKNIGVSSLPLSAKRLYDRFRATAPTAPIVKRLQYKAAGRATRYPAPQQEAPFGPRLV